LVHAIFAVEIDGGEAAPGEDGEDVGAVRDGGGGGVGVFGLFVAGNLAEDFGVPEDAAGGAVEGDDVAAGAGVGGGGEEYCGRPR